MNKETLRAPFGVIADSEENIKKHPLFIAANSSDKEEVQKWVDARCPVFINLDKPIFVNSEGNSIYRTYNEDLYLYCGTSNTLELIALSDDEVKLADALGL